LQQRALMLPAVHGGVLQGRSKVLSRLWNFMTRQENVRGIMIRLLFWEEEVCRC
jgi:hypothetical protein